MLAFTQLHSWVVVHIITWSKRFSKNLASHTTIDGHSDDNEIAQVFADKFRSVYYDSSNDVSAVQEYVDECRNVSNSKGYEYDCVSRIDVALIDECIRGLKRGKANGPDNISSEHLQFAHLSLVIHIKMLIQLINVNPAYNSTWLCAQGFWPWFYCIVSQRQIW